MIVFGIVGMLFLVFHGAAIGFLGKTLYFWNRLDDFSQDLGIRMGLASLIYGFFAV